VHGVVHPWPGNTGQARKLVVEEGKEDVIESATTIQDKASVARLERGRKREVK
jgi:hypothetical protein